MEPYLLIVKFNLFNKIEQCASKCHVSKRKFQEDLTYIFELNQNENTAYQNLWEYIKNNV